MKERITCPICQKRILDMKLEGDAVLETKCMHCGNIVEIKRTNQPKRGDVLKEPIIKTS
jgi:DNA-directed RNA polymerase subunit RPC12/RpoP